jgi:hypothetical protein
MQPQYEIPADTPPSPLYTQAQAAFYRNLPELLKTHDRQWVAYHGEECIGFARTQTKLYERCLRQGLKEDEFYLGFISEAAYADMEEVDIPWDP